MLEYMKLKNLQSHKNSYIEFSPGWTSITGDNHAGKTAIVRALYAIAFNPRGYLKILNRWGKMPTIEIGWNGNVIELNKKGYILNGESYRSVGKLVDDSVPKDVKNVLNLDKINFKLIREGLFLISQTPGERARLINKAVGLGEHEQLVLYCASKVKEYNSSIESKEHLSSVLSANISRLNPVLELQESFDQMDKDIENIEEIQDKHDNLLSLLNDLERYNLRLKEVDKYIDLKDCYEITLELYRYRTIKYNIFHDLSCIVNNIKEAETILEKEKFMDEIKESALKIEDIKVNLQEKLDLMENVSELSRDIVAINLKLNNLINKNEIARKERDKIMKRIGVCPLCDSKLV